MSAFCKYVKFGKDMYDILRTIEFLGHDRLNSESGSKKMTSFEKETTNIKMILVSGITTRTRSQCQCFLEICQIWLNNV